MGVCPISLTKFVGTFSLGLLTGISYTTPILTLPSLTHLPTASLASSALTTLQHRTTRTTLTLASISSLSFVTAYTLASARNKHPYLLWCALVSFAAGQGVELYYNGLSRFPGRAKKLLAEKRETKMAESGYVDVTPSSSDDERKERVQASVNGEKVEAEMGREKWVQSVRTVVASVGFFMSIVGIWGDGA